MRHKIAFSWKYGSQIWKWDQSSSHQPETENMARLVPFLWELWNLRIQKKGTLIISWFIWLVYPEPPRGSVREPKVGSNKAVDSSRRDHCIALLLGGKLNIALHLSSTLGNCVVQWPGGTKPSGSSEMDHWKGSSLRTEAVAVCGGCVSVISRVAGEKMEEEKCLPWFLG